MTHNKAERNVMASLVLAIIAFALAPATGLAQPSDQNVVADLVLQVQELQDEVRVLSGRLEEQERELANVKQRQRDQYLDLDQRINDLGCGEAGPRSPEPARGLSPSRRRRGRCSEVRPPMDTPSDTVALEQPQVADQAVAATSEDEKAAYDKAFQSLKELRYADAAEEFQSFLSQYPNSEYADNAQYWLGESYYVTRNYDIALEAFQGLMDRFPDSPKVPDALLKVGYTYYETKQWDRAREALTQVQEKYPDTTLARLAESRLRSMRMEGHY
jgi:tol-pal system protein YbgF